MWLFDFIFSLILQIGYVDLRISRRISDSPLNFEITGVDCICYKIYLFCQKIFIHRHILQTSNSIREITQIEEQWSRVQRLALLGCRHIVTILNFNEKTTEGFCQSHNIHLDLKIHAFLSILKITLALLSWKHGNGYDMIRLFNEKESNDFSNSISFLDKVYF